MSSDHDPILDSLCRELQVVTATLNDLHHPVYPGPAQRIAELERHLGRLRDDLRARRHELAGA